MKKILLAVATLAAGVSVWSASPAAAQHIIVVDADGRATPTDCDGIDIVDINIQDAIDAASAGDTVIVCPGTYTENVSIDKNLSLIGVDDPTVQGTSGLGDQGTVVVSNNTTDVLSLIHI